MKPVIATTVGGVPYMVRNMKNSVLIPPRDSKTSADAMIMLLNDGELMRELGVKDEEVIKTWEEIAKEVLELYIK